MQCITNAFLSELLSAIHYQNENSYFYELLHLNKMITYEELYFYILNRSNNELFARELCKIIYNKKINNTVIRRIFRAINTHF